MLSPRVDRCKVCNREQHLTSLYALLKKQTTPGAAFLRVINLRQELHQRRQTLLRVSNVSANSRSHGPRGLG